MKVARVFGLDAGRLRHERNDRDRRGARHLVTGVCETDFSGYPDCRDDTMKAMQLALNLGMAARFLIHTP